MRFPHSGYLTSNNRLVVENIQKGDRTSSTNTEMRSISDSSGASHSIKYDIGNAIALSIKTTEMRSRLGKEC
ncbi:hypothetical protein [Rivularia sp. UHCC 0363]|uniref:hypothetical protein n=1 Tax=Rivularia sp. UHCC 0363 TaxID=3110244 RepID=UPI002B1F2ED5|nr:hypothetical protein [Rivularia sp. UHCC 0363]MEA5594170.1 hypothetical protein [Rivularia sp. UHCC 0363]